MKSYNLLILCFVISLTANKTLAQVYGCTDPQANNYNASANVNNGSCTYNVTNLALTDKTPLSTPLLDETSGLEFLSNKLWTFNDSGNSNAIYRVDTSSNSVLQTVTISNATNTDWEDITSNNDYLFIGDFGNNNGNRQNLKIYRIHKNNLPAGATTATAEVINFSYSDQTSFPSLPNNNNFDCESMIFYNDSIHLFSKNWVDLQTRHYVLPNTPGTHVAQYRETLNAGYMVTGASVQKGGVIALIGYNNSGSGPIYVYMLYDYKNNLFFNGNKRKFNVGNKSTYGQVEAVDFFNAAYAYISNEKYTSGSTILPRLRTFNLAPYLPNAFVYPKPKSQFVASTTSICANTSITFTDQSENDPTNWQWSFPGGTPSSSTSQNPVVQYTVAGTYSVTLVAGNATGNDTLVKTSYVTVNAKPVPTINGSTSFCAGSSTTLNAGAGYSSYSWSTGATSQTINLSTAGTFTVTVTNANGCTGTTAVSTTVNPNPTPSISGALTFCGNSSTTLDAGAGYLSYLWNTTEATQTINVSNSNTYTVTVTNGSGCTGSTSVTTNATPTPAPIILGALSFCAGGSTVLDVGPFWQSVFWSTGANTPSITVTTAGSFSVIVTDFNGCTGPAFATTTVNTLPTATTSPGGTVNTCNTSQTLTAGSGAGYAYQWRLNGGPISGATNIVYSATASGNYDVVVTANSCTATSATVTVNLGTGTPTITAGATTICEGTATTLTATAGATAYQWYKNGTAHAGATNASYAVSSSGNYYCNITSAACSGNSNTIAITVINNPAPNFTYTTPITFCSPGYVVLTANTFAGVAYQWQKNSVDIAGATNQTYNASATGKYRVKETANGCTKQSNDLQVNVNASSLTSAIIANGPTSFCVGGSVMLSVSNAIPGYSYQWKNNTVNIAGATTSSYTATAAGSYTCKVSASCGTATSNTIAVTTSGIVALINPSGSINMCSGATATLSANTGASYTYQWMLNGSNITGATNQTYNATGAGNYTVFINSSCGSSTSSATTVNIAALTATASPSAITICEGQATTFSANTGYNYTYQWYRNNAIVSGATNATYATSQAATYKVVITQGGVCPATSNNALLTVINNPAPTVIPGGPTTFCAGGSVTFTANTFAGVTYQWQKNSADIAGATNQTYQATTAGKYRVKEAANGCLKTSTDILVTVNCREDGLNENGLVISEIKVVPNPFTNEFEIGGLKLEIGDKMQMLNVLGEVVLNEIVHYATSKIKLQTANLPSGVYFLQVTTSLEKKNVKVVKK